MPAARGAYGGGGTFGGSVYACGEDSYADVVHGDPRGGVPQSAKVINTILCKSADSGDIDGLLNIAVVMQYSMNLVNLSTVMHRLARLARERHKVIRMSDERFAALHARIEQELALQLKEAAAGHAGVGAPEWAAPLPRCWATVAWVYATLQVPDLCVQYVFGLIAELAIPHLSTFKPFELTNLLWAFAKTQVANELLFSSACTHITRNLALFPRSDLSLLVWSLVTAQQHQSSTLRKIIEHFARGAGTGAVNPVNIANLMWGLATANARPRLAVFQHIGDEALQILPGFKPQELSITLWAFARLGVRHDKLFATVSQRLCRERKLREQIQAQGMANLLWAFNRQKELGSGAGPQLQVLWRAIRALLPHCQPLLGKFKLQEYLCVFQALQKFGLRWGACPEADSLFTAAMRLGVPLTCRPRVSRFVDLLEIFVVFLADATDAPGVCGLFLDETVRVCIARAAELEPKDLARFVDLAAASARVPRPAVAATAAAGEQGVPVAAAALVAAHSPPLHARDDPGGDGKTQFRFGGGAARVCQAALAPADDEAMWIAV